MTETLYEIVRIPVYFIRFGVCQYAQQTGSSLTSLGIFSFLASLKHQTVFEQLHLILAKIKR